MTDTDPLHFPDRANRLVAGFLGAALGAAAVVGVATAVAYTDPALPRPVSISAGSGPVPQFRLTPGRPTQTPAPTAPAPAPDAPLPGLDAVPVHLP